VSVVVIGLEHSRAPFELLEQVVIPDAEIGKVLTALSAQENFREVAVVSTCLRTEIYAVVDRFHDAVDDVLSLLAERSGVSHDVLEEHQSVFFDRGVASHLFKVAAGIESAVPGESEVLGQVRRSMERAVDEGAIGPTLTNLFRAAVSAGRKVRTETGIARGTMSFSHAAVQLAQAQLESELECSKVIVLGAGDLGTGTLGALIDPRMKYRPKEVVLINRTRETAEEVVAGLTTDLNVRVASLEDLSRELAKARLLITAIETEAPEIHEADLSDEPLLILDLGMPRNVAPEIGQRGHVEVLDIGHLRAVVEQAREERRSEMTAAQAVVNEEVERYIEDQRGRGAAPIVVALREHLDTLREAELDRRATELAALRPSEREVVEAITRSLVAKIAHGPTVALKESAGTARGERLVEATQQLFDL